MIHCLHVCQWNCWVLCWEQVRAFLGRLGMIVLCGSELQGQYCGKQISLHCLFLNLSLTKVGKIEKINSSRYTCLHVERNELVAKCEWILQSHWCQLFVLLYSPFFTSLKIKAFFFFSTLSFHQDRQKWFPNPKMEAVILKRPIITYRKAFPGFNLDADFVLDMMPLHLITQNTKQYNSKGNSLRLKVRQVWQW